MTGKIFWIEPLFFLLFGVFHLHRLWALIDRVTYADFWLSILDEKNGLYFGLMGALALLCVAGLWVFFQIRRPWWRWVYLAGGGYVLLDLAAIAAGWDVWDSLFRWMFDVDNPTWNWLWGGFSLLGLLSLLFGVKLLIQKLNIKE